MKYQMYQLRNFSKVCFPVLRVTCKGRFDGDALSALSAVRG